jgi:hypothetical protein
MVITVIIIVIARMIYSAWQDQDQVSSNLSLFITTTRYPFDEGAYYCALLLLHCYNRKVCLPVIPGEGAVSFTTVCFFPIKILPEAEGKISTNQSLMELFPHICKYLSIYIYIAGRVPIKMYNAQKT